MKDYQKRVIAEKKELDNKIVSLATFLFSDLSENITNTERDLMISQLSHMMEYSIILHSRIENFV